MRNAGLLLMYVGLVDPTAHFAVVLTSAGSFGPKTFFAPCAPRPVHIRGMRTVSCGNGNGGDGSCSAGAGRWRGARMMDRGGEVGLWLWFMSLLPFRQQAK